MNFVQGILSDRIINALGWTILHSLWQGLIIGILLLLLLYLFRHHNAIIRYNLSVFSLILIFGFSLLTFVYYLRVADQPDVSSDQYSILISNDNNEINSFGISSGVLKTTLTGTIRSISGAISIRFPLIITFWLLGVFIISARMAGGVLITQKLRNSCLSAIPEDIMRRLRKLIRLMNVRKEVKIYESSIIKVPSVVGYFKPMILLPVSAMTHIPVEQLEAIVAHELAHIKRHDYLINLFQSIIDTLFFYHPIVWIIQQRIRKERENCCDDLALSYSKGQIIYIKALTSIHEIPAQAGFPLLAMGSGKYHLLDRVLRILNNRKMKTSLKDKLLAGFILASAIVIILLNTGGKFISFNSQPENLPDTLPSVEKSLPSDLIKPVPVISMVNTVPEPPAVIEPAPVIPPLPVLPPDTSLTIKDNVVQRTFFKNGKEMDLKMRIEQGNITELSINGEKIPEKDYSKYQAEIDETLDDVYELEEDLSEADEQLDKVENLENIHAPEIDEEKIKQEIQKAVQEIQTIDTEKIRAEMELAIKSACEEMKNIEFPDMDELKLEMEKAMQELKEIDQEKIQLEIQEAMSDIQIDKEEIRREIENSLQEIKEIDMEEIRRDLQNEKIKMDEMLKEIQKLELEKK
jgi:beta-lactamase regulating signal transducer with metallopeptidase domain